jgi:hypothetical protein
MAIQTADLVYTGMYFMGVENRLFRLVILRAAQANGPKDRDITPGNEEDQYDEGDIGLIPVEGDRLGSRDTFLIVR